MRLLGGMIHHLKKFQSSKNFKECIMVYNIKIEGKATSANS